MGRKKKFGHVVHANLVLQDVPWDKPRYLPRGMPWGDEGFWGAERIDKWRRQSGTYRSQPRQHIWFRTPGYPSNPGAVAIVLDLLLRLDPKGEITATELSEYLNKNYQSFLFNAVGVGKIMTNLLAEGAMTERGPYAHPPIGRIMSGGAAIYSLMPDKNAWLWLGHQREWWGDKAEEWMKTVETTREFPTENPWDEVPDFEWGVAMDRLTKVPRKRSRGTRPGRRRPLADRLQQG